MSTCRRKVCLTCGRCSRSITHLLSSCMAPVLFVPTKPLMNPCHSHSLAWELHSQGADFGWSQGFQPLWCICCWLLNREKHGLLHTPCHTLPAQHGSSSAWAHSLTKGVVWLHVYRSQARNISECRMKSPCFLWGAATTSLGQFVQWECWLLPSLWIFKREQKSVFLRIKWT